MIDTLSVPRAKFTSGVGIITPFVEQTAGVIDRQGADSEEILREPDRGYLLQIRKVGKV